MAMVTILEYFDSNRNFNTPTHSPWEQNDCFRTHQCTTKCKNKLKKKAVQ